MAEGSDAPPRQLVGLVLEDRGVLRNRPYAMTRRDLLNHNEDLKKEAARLLAQM